MFKLVQQHDIADCGPACLAMVCQHYGLILPLSEFRSRMKADNNGVSLYGIVSCANDLCLQATALTGNSDELLSGIKSFEISLPAIARVLNNGIEHYVVIFKVSAHHFYIADPAEGKRKYTYDDFFFIWSGHIVSFRKLPGFIKRRDKTASLRRYWTLVSNQSKRLLLTVLISIIVAATGICGSIFIRYFLDNAEVQSGNHRSVYLAAVAVSVIALYFLRMIGEIIRGYLLGRLSEDADVSLMLTFHHHIMDLPLSDILNRKTGDLMSRFNDVSNITELISGTCLSLVLDVAVIAICFAVLMSISSLLSYITLLIFLAYCLLTLLFYRPTEQINRKLIEECADIASHFTESVGGLETIKSYCAEWFVKQKAANKFCKYTRRTTHGVVLYSTQNALASMIASIGVVFLLWKGSILISEKVLSIGSLISFYSLLNYFLGSLQRLLDLLPQLLTAKITAERLNDILDLDAEALLGEEKINGNDICMQGVNFRYGSRNLVLKDINLSVHSGQKIALVGESGSGKTTLAKLIMAFYKPESGAIFIGNSNISSLSPKAIRHHIAYISQAPFLFSDTIRNNLSLGDEDIPFSEIEAACRLSKADEFIQQLPLGYNTMLGENGHDLSAGQKQRLAIARALLRKPKVLILDEATSNLDTVTESAIKETIFRLNSDITCIIIAHRLSTIKDCDRIYVMENGRIVEQGTHNDLLLMGQKYSRFWNQQ